MRKAFIYKARANVKTNANALIWLGLCRQLYNAALEERIGAWKHGVNLTGYDQVKELPGLKRALPEFKQIDAQSLQDVIERLDRAYKDFFRRVKAKRGRAGFPRFKNKNRYDSFTLKQNGWTLDQNVLSIKKLGVFRLRLSRPVEGTIKTVTVRRSRTNNWFVSFSCDNVTPKVLPASTKAIGLDMGLISFVADSDGNTIKAPKFFRKSERLLRRRQRKLSRRVKGSARRKEARILVAKAHEKVRCQRNDWIRKRVNYYVKHYGAIYYEDLSVSNMVRNKHLSKSISDAAWSKFITWLSVKAEEAGRTAKAVNPRWTSQDCSWCGERVIKTLSTRVHGCPHCGLVLDRDINAARNVLKAGQAFQALTTAVAVVA
jgi:putative transposase